MKIEDPQTKANHKKKIEQIKIREAQIKKHKDHWKQLLCKKCNYRKVQKKFDELYRKQKESIEESLVDDKVDVKKVKDHIKKDR